MTQHFGFIRVFSTDLARKAAKQHEDGVSCRRCRAAGTPEPRPRVLEQFQNAKYGPLAAILGSRMAFFWHAIPSSHRDCDSEMIPKPLQAVADKTASTLTFHSVLAWCLFWVIEGVLKEY